MTEKESVNKSRRKSQIYRRFFSAEEIQEIEEMAANAHSLDEEIEMLKILLCRVMEREKDPQKAMKLASLGVKRLVETLRSKRALSGEAADGLAAAMAQALEEIGNELGIKS